MPALQSLAPRAPIARSLGPLPSCACPPCSRMGGALRFRGLYVSRSGRRTSRFRLAPDTLLSWACSATSPHPQRLHCARRPGPGEAPRPSLMPPGSLQTALPRAEVAASLWTSKNVELGGGLLSQRPQLGRLLGGPPVNPATLPIKQVPCQPGAPVKCRLWRSRVAGLETRFPSQGS
jgi:hypothetical protein